MNETVWPGEWLRGVLGVCVLRVLDTGPTYGYAIATSLEAAGLGVIKGGTLYPLLGRLEEAGHVTVEWRPGEGGPGRKYFSLTPAGRAELEERAASWTAFATLTTRLVAARRAADVGSDVAFSVAPDVAWGSADPEVPLPIEENSP